MDEPKYEVTSVELLQSIRFWNRGEFKKVSQGMGLEFESAEGGFIVSSKDQPTFQKFIPMSCVLCVDYREVQ